MSSNSFFIKMVDELVAFSEHDKELADGIRWLDKLSQEQGISFYDMVFNILYQHDMNQRVNNFVNKHTDTIHANIYKRHKLTHRDEKNNAQNNEGI